ncbi:ADP-ribosylglycohydrolase family protein [Pseudonocardia nigra]|uniref:ADP-ribosylglycohydrolase family protein n=1 Tax=Pseudonocardia nigra TaxID=1921578 RepID=UPI001C5D0D35|nr:ADP-ribosylglycohydrolase family protein [Pseudonocardia nigra]
MNLDRAVGVLLGAAAGDALGVPYEYGSRPLPGPGEEARMLGGGLGGYAPGQWSDDTEMATVIAEAAATGADLREEATLDRIGARFLRWYAHGPADVGTQTRAVLRPLRGTPESGAAERMRARGVELHARTGRSAGNGSLMRTAPVALAHLGDPDAIAEAARAVSAVTHYDPQAGDACVLWCLAIDHAVRTGELDVRVGLGHVGPEWAGLLDEAERATPDALARTNGWVVAALQGAWSAIVHTDGLQAGLQAAVAAGGDTDTVAAIAGALLGARYGGSAVPARWRRVLHGWPGLRARDLARLAILAARGGRPDADGWPSGPSLDTYVGSSEQIVPHPDDRGVLLGAVGALRPGVADAVVSLCRLGAAEAPLAGVPAPDHVEVWLIDRDDATLDLGGVLTDSAGLIKDLRDEGKTVFLHCAYAETRTPVVAAAYGALITGSSRASALRRVVYVLPTARPRASLVAGLLAVPE